MPSRGTRLATARDIDSSVSLMRGRREFGVAVRTAPRTRCEVTHPIMFDLLVGAMSPTGPSHMENRAFSVAES
jgi:hypothetical protein